MVAVFSIAIASMDLYGSGADPVWFNHRYAWFGYECAGFTRGRVPCWAERVELRSEEPGDIAVADTTVWRISKDFARMIHRMIDRLRKPTMQVGHVEVQVADEIVHIRVGTIHIHPLPLDTTLACQDDAVSPTRYGITIARQRGFQPPDIPT